MKLNPGYFKAGLFALMAFGVAMTFAILLGQGAFLAEGLKYETYVDESVQGLDVGSPVKFRGVRIGEVTKIDFAQNDCECHKHFIQLTVNLSPDSMGPRMVKQLTDGLQHEIDSGLRMGLAARGLTGGLYVEIGYFDPAANPPLEIDWKPKNRYIPPVASTTSRLLAAAEKVMDGLSSADLTSTQQKVNKLIDEITASVEQITPTLANFKEASAEMPGAARGFREFIEGPFVEDLRATLQELRDSLADTRAAAQRDLHPTFENVRKATEELPESVARMNRAIRRLDRLVVSQQEDMAEAIEGMRAMTEQMRSLVYEVERNGGGVLFSGPPPKTEPGRKR